MSAILGSVLSAWWPQIAGALAAFVAVVGVYLKGRSAERRKAQLEDVSNANQIRKDGADARQRARDGGLSDDGFRRD